MSYKIMSFNIQDFGKSSVLKDSKNIDKIAEIIRENSVDIVAIQEITDPKALELLITKLSQQYSRKIKSGADINIRENLKVKSSRTREICGYYTDSWEGRWAAPISSYSKGSAEGYAFIWNRDRITLVNNYYGEAFEPRIETFSEKNALIRPPFVGRFMPKRGRCEFRLINVHVAFSIPSKMKNESSELYNARITSDRQLRLNEFKELLGVYKKLDKKLYDINRKDRHARYLSPYTFLLGDYNLNLRTSDGEGAKLPEEFAKYEKDGLRLMTVNKELSTLKHKEQTELKGKKDDIDDHLANNYDHFTFDEVKLENHNIENPEVGVVYAFRRYRKTSDSSRYSSYREEISDHLPILLTLDIGKRRIKKFN